MFSDDHRVFQHPNVTSKWFSEILSIFRTLTLFLFLNSKYLYLRLLENEVCVDIQSWATVRTCSTYWVLFIVLQSHFFPCESLPLPSSAFYSSNQAPLCPSCPFLQLIVPHSWKTLNMLIYAPFVSNFGKHL